MRIESCVGTKCSNIFLSNMNNLSETRTRRNVLWRISSSTVLITLASAFEGSVAFGITLEGLVDSRTCLDCSNDHEKGCEHHINCTFSFEAETSVLERSFPCLTGQRKNYSAQNHHCLYLCSAQGRHCIRQICCSTQSRHCLSQ